MGIDLSRVATRDYARLAAELESGTLDPGDFSHADHVGVAFELLRDGPFLDAAARFGRSLHAVASRAGAPEKFNTTVTLAFLSLIAERMAAAPYDDAAKFILANDDLLGRGVLERWYSSDVLAGELARNIFVMPQERRESR